MALGGTAREFILKIVADVTDAQRGMQSVEKSSEGMQSKVLGVGKAVAGGLAIGAVAQFGKASVLAASEAEQSVGAMSSVFGDFADEMADYSKGTAENLGITTQQFNQLSAVTGSLLKGAGLPLEQVTESTQVLTERASDLSAMFGTDVPSAVEAMGSAFKGEFDSLEKYGISLKASDIEARAMAEGYVDAAGEVTDAGKAIATQELILEQSADAAGTFAKESGTLAGQTAIMTARFQDTQAQLGSRLLPIIVRVLDAIMPLVDMFLRFSHILVPVGLGIGALVLAMKGYEMVSMAVKAATVAWTGVQWLLNAALSANPLGLIVIAIAAVVAGIVLLYTKVDWFREFVDKAIDGIVAAFNWFLEKVKSVYNWIKTNWPLLLAIITGPFGMAVLAIAKNWDTIKAAAKTAIDAIKGFVANVWSIISAPFQRGAELAKSAWTGVTTFFRNLPGQIAGFFSGITNIIKAPFEAAFRAIKNLWNSTVGGFGFSVPSWIPGVGGKSFKIPRMAAGGIVNRPTIALIGEAGPEAVIPLGRGGGLGNTIINVYALNPTAETGRMIWNSLREYERTSGKKL